MTPLPGESTAPTHSLVAHHQHFQLFYIVDQELSEACGQHVFCLLIAAIADVGHQDLSLEAPAHSVVDASGFAPVALHKCREQLQNETTPTTAGLRAACTGPHTPCPAAAAWHHPAGLSFTTYTKGTPKVSVLGKLQQLTLILT